MFLPHSFVKMSLITRISPVVARFCSTSTPPQTFAAMFRNSNFVTMGNPVGKTVVGRIYHIVDNDLYIDFGHKFPCVCRRPADGERTYLKGTEVRLKVNSLEMSKRFLGYDKDLSLLEADCTLLGLHK